jgi:arylsulfatase A-like enzyme
VRGTATIVCALCALLACSPPPPSVRPSVLLLTIDTLRPDYLSANGYDRPTSPALDALIEQGFYFEGAVTPIARTTPALASLLTGAYPHTTGLRSLLGSLGPDVTTLAELLRAHDYQTFAVVTNQVLGRQRGLARGFQHYDHAGNLRRAGDAVAAAARVFSLLDRERPFFAWVHLFDPHVPYHGEERWAVAFDPGYEGPYRLHFGYEPGPEEPSDRFTAFPLELPKSVATHRNPLSEEVNAHVRRLYAVDVRRADDAVSDLLAAAREVAGDDLVIVVTADHGESLGEHDFYFDHGDYVYAAATRVPLAFVLPRGHPLAGHGRCAGWVSLVDVVPTLLEILGGVDGSRMAGQVEGRSLAGCMRGEALPPAPVFAESGHSFFPDLLRRRVRNDVAGRLRAVVFEDWKLIWTPFQSGALEWELYDLAADPGETRDLYRPDHPRFASLRSRLADWVRRSAPARLPENQLDEGEAALLRSLGYIE